MTTSYLYDYVLSPFYDRLAKLIWPDFVHPNFITILGGCFAVVAGLLIHQGLYGWAAVSFTLYHMMDNMDGKHARRTGQTSSFGGFLDHFVDGTTGNFAGYSAFATFLIGFDQSTPSELYWRGFHIYSCIWIAPHVVSHFNGGKLVLGSKYFSIDEAFILISLLIFGGWMNNGQCLLPYFPISLVYQTSYAASMVFVSHGFAEFLYSFVQEKNKATTTTMATTNVEIVMNKCLPFVGFGLYWMMGSVPEFFFSEAYRFWLIWTPFVALMVNH